MFCHPCFRNRGMKVGSDDRRTYCCHRPGGATALLCAGVGSDNIKLLGRWTKEVGEMTNGRVTKLKFYLADTEAFLAPLAVIPNIGGPANSYFIVDNRQVWKEGFEEWLECPDSDYIFYDDEDDLEEEAYAETNVAQDRIRTEDREDDDWVKTFSTASEVSSYVSSESSLDSE